jgi:outer membrane lipoprotein-sorting protein
MIHMTNPDFRVNPDSMKPYFSVLSLAALLCAGSTTTVHAASANDLIQAHYKAIGGVEAHKRIDSRVMKAQLEIPSQGFSAELFIQAKAPDKIRSELNIPNVGKVVEGFDGKRAWSDTPFTGVSEKPDDQQAMSRRQADFYQGVELHTRVESWTLKGSETVKGKRTNVIQGKTRDGATETIYFDETSHLIVQMKVNEGGQEIVSRFDDFREVDGLKIPFAIQVDAGSGQVFALALQEVKHGVELDDSLFVKPSR